MDMTKRQLIEKLEALDIEDDDIVAVEFSRDSYHNFEILDVHTVNGHHGLILVGI